MRGTTTSGWNVRRILSDWIPSPTQVHGGLSRCLSEIDIRQELNWSDALRLLHPFRSTPERPHQSCRAPCEWRWPGRTFDPTGDQPGQRHGGRPGNYRGPTRGWPAISFDTMSAFCPLLRNRERLISNPELGGHFCAAIRRLAGQPCQASTAATSAAALTTEHSEEAKFHRTQRARYTKSIAYLKAMIA